MRIVQEAKSTVVMVTHDVDEAVLLADRVVMMTNGPAAQIGEILRVDLPRPRERLVLAHDAKYHELRSAVLEFLYQSNRGLPLKRLSANEKTKKTMITRRMPGCVLREM